MTQRQRYDVAVVAYITKNFEVDETQATELVNRAENIMYDAFTSHSFPYYPGDRIAEAAKLIFIGDDDAESEDFDWDEDDAE